MNEEQATTMQLLRQLLGKWHGEGVAQFPTIPTFEYREELEFTANDAQPFLRYEQRTWRRAETGEVVPSHWEVGFWRVLFANEIEVLNAQGGGRVEVLHGALEPNGDGFSLPLQGTYVANDARVEETAREFVLQGGVLCYTMEMKTVLVRALTPHVQATLQRAGSGR